MKENFLWTSGGVRFKFIKSTAGEPYNWLFLPGGPGLGSEYFETLTHALVLPGTIWHVDLPLINENTIKHKNYQHFTEILAAVEEAVKTLDKVILVGHSIGGMIALSLDDLEKHLSGLILMNSSPVQWKKEQHQNAIKYNLPDTNFVIEQYIANPSVENMRQIYLARAKYFFVDHSLNAGIELLKNLTYSPKLYDMARSDFFETFNCKWVPNTIKTLIIGSQYDHILPPSLFLNDKRFFRENIKIKIIQNAGHFPWIEDLQAVIKIIKNFSKELSHAK